MSLSSTNADKETRTKSHQMKYSTGVQSVLDSCASEADLPETEQDPSQLQ